MLLEAVLVWLGSCGIGWATGTMCSPICGYCHELQQSQSEEVVQVVGGEGFCVVVALGQSTLGEWIVRFETETLR